MFLYTCFEKTKVTSFLFIHATLIDEIICFKCLDKLFVQVSKKTNKDKSNFQS